MEPINPRSQMCANLGIACLVAAQSSHAAGDFGQSQTMLALDIAHTGQFAANITQYFKREIIHCRA